MVQTSLFTKTMNEERLSLSSPYTLLAHAVIITEWKLHLNITHINM